MYVKGIHDKDLIFHLRLLRKLYYYKAVGLKSQLQLKFAQSLSCVFLFVTPWTVVHQAPLSMGFFRQEYWSGLLFTPPGDLPKPGIEPLSPASPYIGRQILYY